MSFSSIIDTLSSRASSRASARSFIVISASHHQSSGRRVVPHTAAGEWLRPRIESDRFVHFGSSRGGETP